jgi:hypothetical protein
MNFGAGYRSWGGGAGRKRYSVWWDCVDISYE